MTAGRGWIAIALVVFATWMLERILLSAYLFGGVSAIQLVLQAMGMEVSPYLCLLYSTGYHSGAGLNLTGQDTHPTPRTGFAGATLPSVIKVVPAGLTILALSIDVTQAWDQTEPFFSQAVH